MPSKRSGMRMLTMWLALCTSVSAQMVVHAVSGKIKAINLPSKTVDMISAGADNEFKIGADQHVSLSFNNDLRSQSVDPNQFKDVGDFAVVYYYGVDNDRTAVAIKDLGAGPFQKLNGTVVNFNKKSRLMTVKDAAGKLHRLTLSDHLVIDTDLGADNGRKFDPHKGDPVAVTYTTSGNQNVAVFLRSMGWYS